MNLYLVRHGESEGNVKSVHQDAETPLSDIGKQQAALVAHRLSTLPVQVIIASDFLRTKQTASIINDKINKPFEFSALLREFKRPTVIEGKRTTDPEVMKIKKTIAEHASDPDWHFSDEENFHDAKNRAVQCLAMLSGRPENEIVVVTHGHMLSMLLSVITFGDSLTPQTFNDMNKVFHAKNTGLTLFEFEDGRWKLKTWNDYAHLG